ncbi:MAG: hypothetical protein ACOVRM_08750 [Planctomycetaceae bacterium]|jgi:hypothetical protein
MKRAIYNLFCTLSLIGSCAAEDMACIVFEDSQHVAGGQTINCDLYYILLGDGGSLNSGEILQITQLHSDREHYSLSKGDFTRNPRTEELTIIWPAAGGEKLGSTEVGVLGGMNNPDGRFIYEIKHHDDASQTGQKLRARLVPFKLLPRWVQDPVEDNRLARLPAWTRLQIYNIRLEEMRINQEIFERIMGVPRK